MRSGFMVRNLDDRVIESLKAKAEIKGHSA